MAGQVENDEEDVIASINMVPFIDVSLVLLIIFMVTSSYIVRTAIEVDLPQASSGSDVAPSTVLLEVDRTGTIRLNGVETTIEALPAQIRAEADRDPALQAIIAGDRSVDYGVVIDVVDVIKLNGVKSFALNIDREEAE